MSDSLYDKLGDILNDILESGDIPLSENEKTSDNVENLNSNFTGCDSSETFRDNSTRFYFKEKNQESNRGQVYKREFFNYKQYPEHIMNALKILKVPLNSVTSEQIKKSYRNIIKQYHPDISQTTQNKTQEIIESYELLKQYFNII